VKIDSLLSMTKSNSSKKRVDAIEALIDLNTPKAAKTFIFLLQNDPDSQVRFTAAHALGFLHSDTVISSLLECLQKEKSKNGKYFIICSLGMQRAKTAAPVLLGMYDKEEYDIQNAILETVSEASDTTVVPTLLHLYSVEHDMQHRHQMVQTIASLHTHESDEFSSKLLDTVQSYWLKSAVITGWSESGYTKGYNQIVSWASFRCNSSKINYDTQMLTYPVLVAMEQLGTPEQNVSTLKAYSNCNDPSLRQSFLEILRLQLKKKITPELRDKIDEEIKTFSN